MNIETARKLVCDSGKKLLGMGLVAGTWGNVSHRIDENCMVVTPSGIPYEILRDEDMSVVLLDDLTYTGKKPSSESPMHAAIYKARPEVNAIIHFHSLYACTASVLGQDILPYLEDMAQIIGASIRITQHAITGSKELTANVLEALPGRFATLLENHGAVCLGRDMDEAFAAGLITEKACHAQILINQSGGGTPLPPEHAQAFHDYYLNMYQNVETRGENK